MSLFDEKPDKIVAELRIERPIYFGVNQGDVFTIGNVFEMIPNPRRKWWTFWRPKLIRTQELQKFTVSGI